MKRIPLATLLGVLCFAVISIFTQNRVAADRAEQQQSSQGQTPTKRTTVNADGTITTVSDDTAEAEFVPGEMLVKFRDENDAVDAGRGQKNARGHLRMANPRLNEIFARFGVNNGNRPFARGKVKALAKVVKLTTQTSNLKEALAALREQPEVEYAELNMIVHAQIAPNDPYYTTSGAWSQSFRDLWGLQSISAETAWDTSQGDGVVVAVVDSGLDYNHEDIAGNVWLNDGEVGLDGTGNDKRSNGIDDDGNGLIDDWHGWDFVTLDGTPGDNDPMDNHGHGTHVSGTIAALGNNGLGVIGVAPHARIMAVKGLDSGGSGSTEDLSNAIIYAADKGASVINLSWGGFGPTSQILIDAISYAHDVKGAVVVAAAGNSNADVGTQVNGFYPACIRDVITVAAVDHLDAKASFSNFGAKIDVTAPGGGDTGSGIQPDRSILSLLSSQAGSTMTGSGQLIVGTKYLRQSGTSMASPHVAGVAALIRAQHPEFSPEQVRQVLRSGANDIGAAGFDTQFGYGRLNARGSQTIAAPLMAQLASPVGNLNGLSQVDVTGSVGGANLSSWRLEYGSGTAPSTWTVIKTSSTTINAGTLATWNLSGINDGTYTLHLVAQALTGEIYQDRLTVVLDGLVITDPSPLSLSITRGEQGVTIRGTVASANFARYTIQILGLSTNWVVSNSAITVTNGGLQPVHDGVLGTWNTTGAAPDTYQITVTETFTNNNWVLKTTKVAVDSTLHPGFPYDIGLLSNGPVSYGLTNHVDVADIDGNGTKEIVIAYNKQVRVIDHTGAQLPGWPQTIDPQNSGTLIQISPAIGDLDGDGSLEIVAANDQSKMFIWSANGTLWPGWPKSIAGFGANIAIDDLTGDGQKEIIVANQGSVRVFDKNGVMLPGWPVFTGGGSTSAPAIGDVDGDGQKEIVVAQLRGPTNLYMIKANGVVMPGWPRAINPQLPSNIQSTSYPTLGDLDGDGKMECVIGSTDGFVYAFRADGSYVAGWPQATKPVRVNTPVIGDIDGDGLPEVVAGNEKILEFGENENYLYAWHADGAILPNWPVKYDRPVTHTSFGYGAPTLADLDQDGRADIIVSSDTMSGSWTALNAYKSDGSKVPGFPKPTLFTGAFSTNTAAVADLDGDGLMELAWIDSLAQLYVYDLSAPSTAVAPWPMFQHDERHTGVSLRTSETIPPTVTITSPAAGSHLAGTVNVTAQASDNAGVANIELYKDNVLVGSSTGSTLNYEWNTTAEADGPHTFVSKAYDVNGNVGSSSAVFDADNTPPSAAAITAPSNGTVITGSAVTISANATDSSGIQKIDFYADGVLVGTDTSAPFTVNWNTINASNGSHSLHVVATDTAGNSTTSPAISVSVDHLGPTVALTNPVNGAVIGGIVNLAVNVFDGEGVQKVQYYRDSSVLLGSSSSAPFSFSWDATSTTNGAHTLFAVATDLSGNTATSATISVTVDKSLPTNVSITAPASNAVLSGSAVAISATASDNIGISRVDFYRDGNVLLGTDNTAPYGISWDITSVTAGAHTLTVVAIDLAGNTKTSSVVNVSVDNTPPEISLSAPANGAFVTGTIAVTAAATDNVGITKVEFYRDNNVLLTTDTSSPYTFNWNSTTVPEGAHNLYAIVQDKAGFRTTSATVAITVDNTAPTVAITSPANGAAILPNQIVNISANASDNFGVVKVDFFVGTTLTCTVTTAPYICVWQVPNQRANFNLKATAYDAAGKTTTHTISVSSR